MTGSCRFPSVAVGVATVVLVFRVVWPAPVYSEPEVYVQETYYQVMGTTAVQIRQSLDRNSPIRQDGQSFDAHTKWDVDWQYRWSHDRDGTCRLTGVTTQVRIRYTLPGLQNTDDLTPDLAERWEQYLRALSAHEKRHAALGIGAARAIERQLLQIGDRSSCDQLEIEANTLAWDIISRYALLETRYDADSNFGELEGARFP